jgi:hypothetical protein
MLNFVEITFGYAIIILVIFGAIIMPDGSGITIPGWKWNYYTWSAYDSLNYGN